MNEQDTRITDLEIRYMHQQDVLNTLSDIIREQQTAIDRLKRQVESLELRSEPEGPGNEKPPHY